jgi:hypothetical protein
MAARDGSLASHRPAAGAAAIRTLDPGYFALVMATGIVSRAVAADGAPRLSGILLALTIAGLGDDYPHVLFYDMERASDVSDKKLDNVIKPLITF